MEYVPPAFSVIVPDITSSLNPPVSEKIAAGGGAELIVEMAYDPFGDLFDGPPGPVGPESLPHAARNVDVTAAQSASSARPRPDDAFLAS